MSAEITADENNAWRLDTPGNDGWSRSARPDSKDKFFMCSADGHVQEPNTFLKDRIDEQYHARLPGVIQMPTEKGASSDPELYQKTEGFRPAKINWTKPLEGLDKRRQDGGRDPQVRLDDLAIDGVDAEILFPNKGLTMWATPDEQFSHAMCKAYNDWAWEDYGAFNDRLAPMAAIAPLALEESIEEIQRVAKLGFKGLSLATRSSPRSATTDTPRWSTGSRPSGVRRASRRCDRSSGATSPIWPGRSSTGPWPPMIS